MTKPQRFKNGLALAEAWRKRQITGPAVVNAARYTLTADPNNIWIGDRVAAVVRYNPDLNLTIRIRSKCLALAPYVKQVILHACELPEKRVRLSVTQKREIPRPYVRVNRLPDILETCDLVTLQSYVWESSEGPLKNLIKWVTVVNSHRLRRLEANWDTEVWNLNNAGLSVPQDLLNKKAAKYVTRRLLNTNKS